ncbi:MAG: DUF2877 domain-containing protein [Anaerolineaceae bacterium]
MKQLTALFVADDLVSFLSEHEGQVARSHSLYHHAANLIVGDDDLITITSHDEIPPMGIAIDCSESLMRLFKSDDKVILNPENLTVLNSEIQIDLCEAQIWDTDLLSDEETLSVDALSQKRTELLTWLEKQPGVGLLPLLNRLTNNQTDTEPANDNLYSRYIGADLEKFTTAIMASDWEGALALTDKLVGFGMGSTPSCDDFLMAYLLVFKVAEALHPVHFPWVSHFNHTVAKKAIKQSPLISAMMLRHAANGKVSSSHQNLLRACLFNNYETPVVYASQVIQYGATSGADFLLGLVCALGWYQHVNTVYIKEGEEVWALA